MKTSLLLILFGCALSACSQIPPEAYANRGDPEGLLDVSSEVVNLEIHSEAGLDELTVWIEQDEPSRAEIYCPVADPNCEAAMDAMEVFGIEYRHVPSPEYTAALVYERVLARDCANRFRDNTVNPYHLHHPSYGCSLAVNMVQQVSDKRQFVRPNLMDAPDARKAVQAYQNYMIRREVEPPEGISDGLLSQATVEE